MRDSKIKKDNTTPLADTPTDFSDLYAKRYHILKPLLDKLLALEYGSCAVLGTGSDLDVYVELLSSLIINHPNNKSTIENNLDIDIHNGKQHSTSNNKLSKLVDKMSDGIEDIGDMISDMVLDFTDFIDDML